jgi:HAD superfamily hydrolase (TIGR01549 family)
MTSRHRRPKSARAYELAAVPALQAAAIAAPAAELRAAALTTTPAPFDAASIEAVLLDLDGTLVDASHAWERAFAEVLALARERYPDLARLGTDPEAHRALFVPLVTAEHLRAGGGEWRVEYLHRALARLLEHEGHEDEALATRMFEAYYDAWPRHVRLYPDTLPLIEALQGRFRLGIVSNGIGSEQRLKIGPLGLEPYFEAVAISEELGVLKPDPRIFEHVLGALGGIDPARAIHVGDDLIGDVGGAHAAGLAAGVWLNRGVTVTSPGTPSPGDSAPDVEVRSLTELLPLLMDAADR